MIHLAVVTPIPAVRVGLQALLSAAPAPAGRAAANEVDKTIQVVYEAASLEEFANYAPIDNTDVLLVTAEAVSLPALRHALADHENSLALLLLADTPQAASGLPSLPLRAWGILPLDSSAEELLAAISALYEGLLVGAPNLLQPAFSRALLSSVEESDALTEPLTERESQVLQLLARGLANKQIAAALGISEHTVKFHVSSIYTKLGASNRTEAVRSGVQRGLVAY